MRDTSKIGFGTAAIGRPLYINIKNSPIQSDFSKVAFRKKGMAILEEAYKRGIRYFDTAPGYGMAEQMLIDWLIEKKDETIQVATKWGYSYEADFNPKASLHEIKEHSLEMLTKQWVQSQALFPYLTIYQIHSATFATGVLENEEILNRLAELREEHDLIIGITTTGDNQGEVLKKALDVEVNGKQLFDLYQVSYNIFDQSFATIAAELHSQAKRIVIKEAMANGRIFPNKKYPNYTAAYNLLKALAEKYRVGPDAVALRFCVDSIPVYKVLSGAAEGNHLVDNLKALDFELDKEDLSELKKLSVEPETYWAERKQLSWN